MVLKRPSAALLHVRDWEERKPKTSIGVHLSVWCIALRPLYRPPTTTKIEKVAIRESLSQTRLSDAVLYRTLTPSLCRITGRIAIV